MKTRGCVVLIALAAGAVVWAGAPTRAAAPRFFPDDPIAVDPERQDASGVRARELRREAAYVEIAMTLGSPGGIRAANVNTADEVPDSSWYTNRLVSSRPSTGADIVPEPIHGPQPAGGRWTVLSADHAGTSLRLTARDANGTEWAVKFDPEGHPELSTGAEAIASRLLFALGYNTAESHIVRLRSESMAIGDRAPVSDRFGRPRFMKKADLDVLLSKAERSPDGAYRAIASRIPEGVDLGPFSYAGTRSDDPNDIFPHEDRRELRGLRVFCAWLNHDDPHSIDTRDVLVDDGARRIVRHYLVDLESTLGSGTTRASRPRVANEYVWGRRRKIRNLLTFGLSVQPWQETIVYPQLPSVGRFEAAAFEPGRWRTRYQNAAFGRARGDDAFWAARRVVAVSDEAIRAAVKMADYADPSAAEYVAQALITRRDKVGRLWLNGVLPLVDCSLDRTGMLTCSNVAVDRMLAEPPDAYRIRWHRFDNQADGATAVGNESAAREARFTAPP